MEWGCMGFLLGAITAIIFVGIGVCFGRSDKRELDNDSDVRVYIPDRDRNRSGNNGQLKQMDPKEVMTVLYLLRIGASNKEKHVIDYLIDKEERGNIHEKQNQA